MVSTKNRLTKKTLVRISKSGQVTLPVRVRNKLGVALGDQVEFVEKTDGTVIVRPTRKLTLDEMAGKFGKRPEGMAVDELIQEAAHEGMERRASRWKK